MKLEVSILSVKNNFENWIQKLNETDIDKLHLDIMDKTFTPNESFSLKDVKRIFELSKKNIDIHIMSTNIDKLLEEYIKLKPNTINIHYEAVNDLDKYITLLKENNIKVGIAINPETNVSEIYDYINKIDQVLVMSVKPGYGGQSFIDKTIDKLKLLKELKRKYKFNVIVDGGINDITIKKVKKYADIVVSGSYITNSDDYQSKINKLK